MAQALSDLIHHLDLPSSGTEVDSPTLRVRGWVAYPQAQRVVDISIGVSNGIQPLRLCERPDVARSIPRLSCIGFDSDVDPKDLVTPTTIFFRFEDGRVEARGLDFRISQASIKAFDDRKKSKLGKIICLLRCPHCKHDIEARETDRTFTCRGCGKSYGRSPYQLDFLSAELRSRAKIFSVEDVSSNEYDPATLDIIARYRDGLILDDGSGLRSKYFANVVNFDVVAYKTTDVLGIGESMPFRDDSFDAVISVAVLEHVRNPFDAAREIERVLKPGGEVYVAVPFLQPFHGYPDHYYNMTSSGLRNLFPNLQETSMSVPASGLPVWALSWILGAYAAGLPPSERVAFSSLRISELMADPVSLLSERWVSALSKAATEQLACVNVLRATKPKRPVR